VLELAFCWNASFVPFYKWRVAHFYRLPICPEPVRHGIERFPDAHDSEDRFRIAEMIVTSIKLLVKDLYHLDPAIEEPLFVFAHAMHDAIEDPEVKKQTVTP
jgi:hypothetical protein